MSSWYCSIINCCFCVNRWIRFITTNCNWLCWWLCCKNIFILWYSWCITMMTMNLLSCWCFNRCFIWIKCCYFSKNIFFYYCWRWTWTNRWCIICRYCFITKFIIKYRKLNFFFLPNIWIELSSRYEWWTFS